MPEQTSIAVPLGGLDPHPRAAAITTLKALGQEERALAPGELVPEQATAERCHPAIVVIGDHRHEGDG